MIGWMKYGGGQELYNELVQQVLGLNLVGFLTGPMPTQPLGWFKTPVETAEAFNGLKYRTVGLSADLFKELGAAPWIAACSRPPSSIIRPRIASWVSRM
jgi:TRAP-type mannitol/chloroaromatic compound transport system substrate-binding protein